MKRFENLKTALLWASAVAMTPALAWAQDATPTPPAETTPAETVPVEAAAEVVDMATAASLGALNVEMVFIFNSLLFLFGGVLVFWMAAGFAMLEAGFVRSKNVAVQLTKNIGLFALAALMYYLIGYNLMYPLGETEFAVGAVDTSAINWLFYSLVDGTNDDGEAVTQVIGYFGAIGPAVMEAVGITAETADDVGYASTGSDFFFQLMFCATTASIVSGALAERIKLNAFFVFVLVLTALIYPIQASWKWGGGFLDAAGFLDFAGSTIVHSVGGWAALMGAILLGPRIGKYSKDGRVNPIPGSNLALATLGTFILWMGWFGFNGASQLAMGTIGDVADVSRIFANTNMAAAAGAVAAMILSTLMFKKADLTLMLNGALGGLVAITAEPLTPSLGMAVIIGGIGGLIVVLSVPLLDKFKIDDVVGAVPVHLFAGIWGTLAVVLTNGDATIGAQLYGIVAVGAFVIVTSLITWFVIKLVMGLRVDQESEVTGLDKTELGMEAYPDFTRG